VSNSEDSLVNLFTSVAISGSVAAAGLTAFANWLMRRRQEYLEVAKYKIDQISKFRPYIKQLESNHDGIAEDIFNGATNDTKAMLFLYYISNILYIRRQMYEKSPLQLSDLYAENLINDIGQQAFVEFTEGFNDDDLSIMTHLVNDSTSYVEFSNKMRCVEYSYLHNKIEKWLLKKIKERDFEEIKLYSKYYADLLAFELSRAYSIWYGETPRMRSYLSEKTVHHLKKTHPRYYWSICSFSEKLKYLASYKE
jgi:hypothetical protein